jgi:dGTP triphosphohydrolase
MEGQETTAIDLTTLTNEQVMELVSKNTHLIAEIDRRCTKAIETYKEKTLPALVNEQVQAKLKELNPTETPEQKRIREMEQKLAEMESKETKSTLKAKALQYITAEKLPHQFINFLDFSNSDNLDKQLEQLKTLYTSELTKTVEAEVTRLTGRKVTSNTEKQSNPYGSNPYSKATLNLSLQNKIEKENPELAKYLQQTK